MGAVTPLLTVSTMSVSDKAAKLRTPPHTTEEQRGQRVDSPDPEQPGKGNWCSGCKPQELPQWMSPCCKVPRICWALCTCWPVVHGRTGLWSGEICDYDVNNDVGRAKALKMEIRLIAKTLDNGQWRGSGIVEW
eukprot:6032687-Amphidinium_carterae.2